jgi:hypothetical protein
MEPLNKQERTEAFIKVLALFLLAVIVVAIPMYYAFKLPSKVDSANSSEFESIKKQLAEMKKYDLQFLLKTDSALVVYNEFAQEKDNFARDRMQLRYSAISNKMEDFSRTIRNDTVKPLLYSNVVFSFNKLFSNRSEIFTLEEKLAKIESDKEGGAAGEEKKEDTQTLLSKQIEIIKKALAVSGGNRKNAARELGMTEKLFTQILKEYKL